MVKNKHIYFLVLGVFIIKLILLPFAQTTDADAVTRIFSAVHWKDNPVWIKTNVWGPLHYYLNGVGLYIWDNRVIMPKLINIVFSCLTLLPFYYFTRREFNEKGAFFATIYLAFCPVLFQTSFLALSNTPFLFLLALSLNELSKGMQKNSLQHIIFAGLFISLAGGFRYEAWLIMAIFGVSLLIYGRIKHAIIYSFFAGIFPVIWMISNYKATGDPMFSLNGNYVWTHDMMGINDNVHWKEYLRRILFFPYSWLLMVGFLAGYIIVKQSYFTIKNKDKKRLFWLIPFLVIFLFMIYNSFKGNLLNHHRFVGTLVIFSLPFFAQYFTNYTVKKRNLALGFLTVAFAFSFTEIGFNKGAKPFPTLRNKTCNKIQNVLEENFGENGYIILDFIDWEDTYYYALNCGYHPNRVYIQEGAKNSLINEEKIWTRINTSPNGLVVYKENSVIHQFINRQMERIETKNIANFNNIRVVQLTLRTE